LPEDAKLGCVLNRASIVYACLFVIFASGIWVILRVGSRVAHAPEDLSGQWRPINSDGSMQAGGFTVDQSGKYFQFRLDDGTVLNLTLGSQPASLANSNVPAEVQMTISGQGWQINANGASHSDDFEFAFKPPTSVSAHISSAPVEYHRGDPPKLAEQAPASISSKGIADTK
jgi:hypothetical protein